MKRARDIAELSSAITAQQLSHRRLATLASCSRNTPARLLAGRRVGDHTAVRIARILKRPVNELFEPSLPSTEQRTSHNAAVA